MAKRFVPSHRERVALFRQGIVGDLLSRELARGDLEKEFKKKALVRYRAPGREKTRKYHWKTIQHWYLMAKADPVGGLLPQPRTRGAALKLDPSQREDLLTMRSEHRSAAAELILNEAERHGVIPKNEVSVSTVRRLFQQAELPRESKRVAKRSSEAKQRWSCAEPGDLWHGDVCHLIFGVKSSRRDICVHGLLDDASRYSIALEARNQERELDMLEVFGESLLKHPPPKILYLDNGACYRGEILDLLCQRLGIRLVHATPYSPEARGKMERFWRTLRQRCTDHLSGDPSLHDINQAIWAWTDAEYLRRPHAGLLGNTPRDVYMGRLPKERRPLKPLELAKALEFEQTRRVKNDATFSVDGHLYEVEGRHIAGKQIQIVVNGLTGELLRASWQDRPLRFGQCNPIANSHRPKRDSEETQPTTSSVPFNPISALLDKAREDNDE